MQYIKILASSFFASIIICIFGLILTGHIVALFVKSNYFGLSATTSSYFIDAIAWGLPALISSILISLINPKAPKAAAGTTAALTIGLFIAAYYFSAQAQNPNVSYIHEIASLQFTILYAAIILTAFLGAHLSSYLRKPN